MTSDIQKTNCPINKELPLFEQIAPIPPGVRQSSYPMLPFPDRRKGTGIPVPVSSRFLKADTVYTESGSAAIQLALRELKIGCGDQVMLPGYHCPSMVWPILAVGAEPVFLPVTRELQFDIVSIESLYTRRVRAILLPHYFGVMQKSVSQIRTWCDEHRIFLIEDCAHMFYGVTSVGIPGSFGHLAIASTRKFFSGTEGGALISNIDSLKVKLPAATLFDELRSLYDLGQLVWKARMADRPNKNKNGDQYENNVIFQQFAKKNEGTARPATKSELQRSAAHRTACRLVRLLIRIEKHEKSAGIRRSRWLQWRAAMDGLPGVKAFTEDVPTAAPYVFVASLTAPEISFPALKSRGLPIWRWDRIASSDCSVSRRLAVELIQLPVHQSMSDARFQRVINEFIVVFEKLRR